MMLGSLWDANKLNYFDNMAGFLPDWTEPGSSVWRSLQQIVGELARNYPHFARKFPVMPRGRTAQKAPLHNFFLNQLLFIKRFRKRKTNCSKF